MKKYLLLFLLSVVVAACSSAQKEVVLIVSNPMDIDRFNEIAEIQWPVFSNAYLCRMKIRS